MSKMSADTQHSTAASADTSPARTAAEIRLWEALAEYPGATAAQLAAHAGAGRSTATKVLSRWDADGWVTRSPGTAAGGRRAPDNWAVAARPPDNGHAKSSEPASTVAIEDRPRNGGSKQRLPKGALRGLVEDFLREPDRTGRSYTPGEIGRKLDHSPGAVSNALDRLAEHGTVVQTSQKPRRYSLAVEATDG